VFRFQTALFLCIMGGIVISVLLCVFYAASTGMNSEYTSITGQLDVESASVSSGKTLFANRKKTDKECKDKIHNE